ncbi:MAG: sugar transferase [Bacteroidales bacterium]|nr:sugar transferase [Bacteroidales bacterium]
MLKHLFDIFMSLAFIVILLPVFIIISIWIMIDSRGGVFYLQSRVGKNNRDFRMYKFRSMRPESDTFGLLTIGDHDPRVTRAGKFLRKTKLDELPQMLNILKGNMSFVGPRPEVRKYVELYSAEQMKVLSVRPGLTDYASLEYIDEDSILGQSDDPDRVYITVIMPAKLELNLKYIRERSFTTDLTIMMKTFLKII